MPLLAVERLNKSFGAIQVARDLSFTLEPGDALGIIGPNGAGKSSLFNLIGGNLAPASGRILFDGTDITRLSPQRRCRAGIGRTYQVPQPFAGLTVFENLCTAAAFGGPHRRDAADHCAAILERTGLSGQANRLAGSLRLLDLKRLELARALAASPRLLLLDEVAGGLTEGEARELVQLIDGVRRSGVAILWIEHVVHALLAVIDRLIVLDFGARIMEGEPRAVMASPAVMRIYLGLEPA